MMHWDTLSCCLLGLIIGGLPHWAFLRVDGFQPDYREGVGRTYEKQPGKSCDLLLRERFISNSRLVGLDTQLVVFSSTRIPCQAIQIRKRQLAQRGTQLHRPYPVTTSLVI